MSEKVGTWPQVCVQRAFVDGASWWIWANGSTPFPAERDLMETEAVRRYGEPASDLIAAAEERGRRAGIEEAADKAYTAAHEAAEEIWKLHGGVQQAPCYQAAVASLRTIRKIESDLAPRDSAPDLVVCDYCPEHPHPLNDDGTKCVHPRAPRDSGKGAK